MNAQLFQNNMLQDFWSITPAPPDELWQEAVNHSLSILNLPNAPTQMDTLIPYILSEESYGENVWHLSDMKRLYYMLKPIMPRFVITLLRRMYHSPEKECSWYMDDRYAKFLWGVLNYVISHSGGNIYQCKPLWPQNKRFAFTMTHDIEDAEGQALVRDMADIDEQFGFRSVFFFVPDRYSLDYELIEELKERGFEIGIHGLKHDGKLFLSEQTFNERADKINQYIDELGAVGFSAPFTHRNGEWLQKLHIQYDRSFFDIDLYEPMPGGVMTIWPYQLGNFIELPYTLLQDFTLTRVMKEKTPTIWLEKLAFIRQYHGMALLNTHPDYLKYPVTKQVYIDFLRKVQAMDDYWHALPNEVARWWSYRQSTDTQYMPLSKPPLADITEPAIVELTKPTLADTEPAFADVS